MSSKIETTVLILPGHSLGLAPCLRALANQTCPPAKVIVLADDAEAARGALPDLGELQCRVLPAPPGGLDGAWRVGLAQSASAALMVMSADDLPSPTTLEELSAALAVRPHGIACCPWMEVEPHGESWLATAPAARRRRRGRSQLQAWLKGWRPPLGAQLWSRAACERISRIEPPAWPERPELRLMRGLAAGLELAVTEGGMVFHRRRPDERHHPVESDLIQLEQAAAHLSRTNLGVGDRAALAAAFYGVARRARAERPDLRRRALEAAARCKGPGWLRNSRRGAARPTAAAGSPRAAHLRASVGPVLSPDLEDPAPERPLISVVVPTYNRADLLRRAVESILAQTYDAFEVLIVDDASTDETESVVATVQDPRVRYIRQPQNRGVAAARNRGMREARGGLIAFLDSDDEWTPSKLEEQVRLIRRRPNRVGLFYTGVLTYGAGGDQILNRPARRGAVLSEILHRNLVHSTCSVIIRREVVEAVGFFDESLPAIEDFDYWTRVARLFEFDVSPEPLTIYHDEAQDADAALERRSRNFSANMAARRAHGERYAYEAERAGVRHLFLLESARRHLASPSGDPRQAALHLLEAIRLRPSEPRLYLWLLFSLTPRRARDKVGPTLKAARSRMIPERLWFGSAASSEVR